MSRGWIYPVSHALGTFPREYGRSPCLDLKFWLSVEYNGPYLSNLIEWPTMNGMCGIDPDRGPLAR